MSLRTHSPTPWSVKPPPSPADPRLLIMAADGSWIAEVRPLGKPWLMAKNAALLSAAGELLEAARKMRGLHAVRCDCGPCHALDAAIAKAEGR